uniref:TonB-dependent receptor n=1 Tax=Magnetococcus massalia (strain MO-1) TaxID=451514 RepID=A0A1S7LNQ4_MAGMO|nr:Exported protein of unknown function. Containing TonB-dependent receptor plug domain and TonB dependent receptor domain [Candidatus Magnetococcus massalia]
MRLVMMLTLSSLLLASPLRAAPEADPSAPQAAPQAPSMDEEFDDADLAADLMDLLKQETAVATKTKLNADYVPGIVTLLYGVELLDRGYKNVHEALNALAGIETYTDQSGDMPILVRGAGGTFGSGQVKLMINGMPMNTILTGGSNAVLTMPLELVDRIEAIRGPGSAVYGEFAYSGVINIITHQKKSNLFVRAESFDTQIVGGNWHWQDEEKKRSIRINTSWEQSDGEEERITADSITYSSDPASSTAPGNGDTKRNNENFLLEAKMGDYFLQLGYQNTKRGQYYGSATFSVPDPDKDLYNQNTQLSATVGMHKELTPTLTMDSKVSWLSHRQRYHTQLLPDNFDLLGNGFIVYTAGYYSHGRYRDSRVSLDTDFHLTKWDDHAILLTLSASNTNVHESGQSNTANPATSMPLTSYTAFDYENGARWPSEQWYRTNYAIALQDEYQFRPDLTITAGARLDYNSDFGRNISPRIAAVWRYDDQNIFKAQFSRSFRPPAYFELANNANLNPSTSSNAELGYIHVRGKDRYAATLYWTELKDLVDTTGPLVYLNTEGLRMRGFELEAKTALHKDLDLSGNLSYGDAHKLADGTRAPLSGDWLANIWVDWNYSNNLALHGSIRHVGDRARPSYATEVGLQSYTTLDLSGTYRDAFDYKGLSFKAGVRNLFDEKVRVPADASVGSGITRFADDIPQRPRTLWVESGFDF